MRKLPSSCLAASLLLPALLVACSSGAPMAAPENMARAACEAIVGNDIDAYNGYSITMADFILRDEGLSSPMKQQMSYAGKVLKPEETARQQADFRRAAGELSGRSCEDVKALGSASVERLDGGTVDVAYYAFVTDEGQRETPLAMIVGWGGEGRYRLLGLAFKDEAGAAE